MDESVEVKKGGLRGRRAWKWLGAALVVTVAAGVVYRLSTRSDLHRSPLSGLPVSEQNVLIFDEAMRLLKANYYDPKLLGVPEWPAYEASWRKKAAESKPGLWLYVNVLGNFSRNFPNSHVEFMAPPTRPLAPAKSTSASKQSERILSLFMSGPGFEMASIRRGNRTQFVVTDVLRGSPAERAGVTPGWAVTSWNMTSNKDDVRFKGVFNALTTDMVREVDRTANLTGSGTTVAFSCEVLPQRTDFETRQLRNGSTYLRFDHFNDWALTNDVLEVIDAASPAGLILDLRRNSGGRQLHMTRVLGRLLGGGVAVGETRAPDSSLPVESIKFGDEHYEGPVVVLIGPSTTSAAEITAAAMQDLKRGVVIGRTTNGSVLSSRKFDLPDGGVMMIPTSDYVRPENRRIEGVGVQPDIWILPTLDDVRSGRDPAIERAMRELQKP
jgi:C-terminal processing protease CtpA/Prc